MKEPICISGFDKDLLNRIDASAEKNDRSRSAEIRFVLLKEFPAPTETSPPVDRPELIRAVA